MTIEFTLTAEHVNQETVQQLTRDLCRTINQETELQASIGEQKIDQGAKGDPITIGTILLAALGTGGGAAALINVFKSYVDRSKELSIKLKKQNGDEIEITSKNFNADEIEVTLNELFTRRLIKR